MSVTPVILSFDYINSFHPTSLSLFSFIEVNATFWGEAGPFRKQSRGSHQDSSLPCSANEPAVYWQERLEGGARRTTYKKPTHWTTETYGTTILVPCQPALHFSTRPNSCWELVSLKAKCFNKYVVSICFYLLSWLRSSPLTSGQLKPSPISATGWELICSWLRNKTKHDLASAV